MILHCPSCSTRYHHQAVPESLLASAHCSECDEVFPLKAPRRRYVIVPPTGSARINLRLDAPRLAEPIHRGNPEPAASAVLSHTSQATPIAEEQATSWPLVESDLEESSVDPFRSVGPTAAEQLGEALPGFDPTLPMEALGPGTAADDLAEQTLGETSPEPVRARKPAAQSAILVLAGPACAGAGLAYYLAGGAAGQPWVSLTLGGVLGLLVGWGCLRWMRRAD